MIEKGIDMARALVPNLLTCKGNHEEVKRKNVQHLPMVGHTIIASLVSAAQAQPLPDIS